MSGNDEDDVDDVILLWLQKLGCCHVEMLINDCLEVCVKFCK